MTEVVAELLERAAIRVETSPGLNVLDAIRDETRDMTQRERDAMLADTFFRLLDYLPPNVESLARWSDNETSDRVAGKLRQLARTMRKGGPTLVESFTSPPSRAETELVETAGSHNRKPSRRPESEWPREAQLRQERGRVESALTRMRRAKHPRTHDITEKELRLSEIDRELAELTAEDDDADLTGAGMPARRPGTESGLVVGALPVAVTADDHRAVALIVESRSFPADRVPVRRGA